MKKTVCILLSLLFIFSAVSGMTVFAQGLKSDDGTNFKSFIKIGHDGDYTEISEQTFQAERTASLQYSTYIYGGRPQFDQVGLEINFYNDYRGTYQYETVTPDLISVNVIYNLYGILQGSELVLFNP